jgi:hypothetical protein
MEQVAGETDALGIASGGCVPSEFTLEIATIFSSSLDPVFRACLAQLRVSSRGAYWMEQGVAPEVLADAVRIPGRLGPPPAPSQDGAAL